MLLMLRKNWQGKSFHRRAGGEVLEFEPGEPLEVDGELLVALAPDVGRALVPVAKDKRGKIRVPDDAEELAAQIRANPRAYIEAEPAPRRRRGNATETA